MASTVFVVYNELCNMLNLEDLQTLSNATLKLVIMVFLVIFSLYGQLKLSFVIKKLGI